MGEHRAGLEKGNAKADSAEIGGRLPGHTEQARVREQEDVKSDDCGVLVRRGSGDGMGAEESRRNTGSPRKQSIKAQTGIPRGTGLACVGGGEARSSEDTRNERRAKGPQFQGNATSGARAEIGASLPPAEKLLKLQETLHAKSMKTPWSESRMRETRTSGLMSGGVETGPLKDTAPPLDSTKFEKRCEARQNEIRDGSVLAHVTKRIAAITPPRALVVLRFLLNTTEATHCLFPNPITACYLTNYIRSAETGEIFGLGAKDLPGKSQLPFQSLCSRGYKRSTLSVAGFNLAMDMSDQPNLLLLWTDQQRADTLACHGNTTIDAPNLNELTERSLVFEQAYCSQPVCTPSRGTILTGLWPHAHGCLTNNIPLPGERKTIAELVGDEYLCAYYGKWHLGDELVAQHGFEDWVSIEDGIYRPYYSRPEYLRERSSYHKFLVKNGYAPDSRDQRGEPVFSRDFAAAMGENFTKAHFLGQEAARFLRQRKDGRPFVLSVCFLEPHPPVFGPLNHLYDPDEIPVGEAFIRAPDERASRRNRERALDCLRDGFKNYPLDTEWDWRRLLANYCGLVTLVDRAVGEILQALRESGQEDNTVIAYTSDHGEMLGDHALMGKGVFYEESSRIPLFIRVPWIADEGRMINGRISQIDLVPTLLDLMNQPLGEHLQGRSRRPVLEGQETLSDNDVIVEWNSPDGTDQEWRSIFAADGWKLNLCTGDQCELYDLNTDPHELHNRFEEPARRGRIDDLTARIRAWQSTVGDDLPLP